jgi:tetratricopeptide (TPR) repeat protein
VKRVNMRLLLGLVASLAILAGGVYLLRRYQIQRNAGGLAKLARERLEEGKVSEAMSLFQRYLGLRPEDNEAYAEYAKLVLDRADSSDAKRDDIARAYNTLENAVRRNPTDDTLRARLAQFQLRIGRFTDAREHLDVLRGREAPAGQEPGGDDAKDDPAAPTKVQLMLARSYVGTGEFEKAAALVGDLVGYDLDARTFSKEDERAGPTEAYMILAAILKERLKEDSAANEVLEKMLEVNEKDVQAWLGRAQWHRQEGNLKAAAADVDRAIAMAPKDPDTVFASLELSMMRQDLAGAEEQGKKACEVFPNDDRGYRGLASVYLQQNRIDDAERVLREGVGVLPEKASLLLMLAETLLRQNNIPEVQQTIDRVKEIQGQASPAVGLFEARVLIAQQRWLLAKQKLQQVRPLVAGSDELTRQVDLYLGQCFEQLGDFDEQFEANQRVLNEMPTLLAARVGAATAMAAAGKPDEALVEFEEVAASIPPDRLSSVPQVWLPLLQLRVAAQSKLVPASRDWSTVDGLLDTLQQAPEISAAQMALLRADVLVRKGETDAAMGLLEKAAAAHPNESMLWSALATLTLREKGAGAARELLARVPEDLAEDSGILTIDAQIAVAEGGDAAKEALTRIEEKAAGLPDDQAARLMSTLAPMQLAMGNREAGQRLWAEAAKKQPENLQSRYALFDLAIEEGNLEQARAAAEELAKVAGQKSTQAQVARATVRIFAIRKAMQDRQGESGGMPALTVDERQSLDEARNLLIEAENERPGWYRIQTLFAEIEGLKGNVPAAIERLQKAVELGGTNPAVVRQLVSLLYNSNRIEEAQKAINALGPDGVAGFEKVSAEMELRSGKFEEAVALAERGVAADSKNADELLWLGQLLDRSGKKEQAVQTIERAVELAPDRAEAWLALFSLQLAQGKRKAAELTLDRSADKLQEPVRSLALAQGYEILGKLDDAERLFTAAAAAAPDDMNVNRSGAEFLIRCGRLVHAREALEAILAAKGDSEAVMSTQAWARRMLAELTAQRGNFRSFQAAIALLEKNAGPNGALGPEDMALKINLLYGRPEPASWRQAIEALELLAKSQPLSTSQRLQLAQLKEKTGDWEEGRNALVSIASAPTAPVAFLSLLIEKLIDHNELTSARVWMRRLKTSHPDSPATLALEAKLSMADNDRETAVAAAKRLMPAADAAQDQTDQLVNIAKLYEELGFAKAADKVLSRLPETSPEAILARAAFLGRQKQTEAAIDLLEKSWDSLPLERLMQTALEAVRDRDSPEQAARLDPWFTRAIRQDPESIMLPLLLAELREIEGRSGEVESIYREILARKNLPPMQVAVAANNLAFHLAKPETAAEATKLIDDAIAELGPHPDLLDTRGLVRLAAGDVKAAVSDLQEAVLQPTATKLLHLAYAQFEAGDTTAAGRSLEAARKKQLQPAKLSTLDRERLGKLESTLGTPPAS